MSEDQDGDQHEDESEDRGLSAKQKKAGSVDEDEQDEVEVGVAASEYQGSLLMVDTILRWRKVVTKDLFSILSTPPAVSACLVGLCIVSRYCSV